MKRIKKNDYLLINCFGSYFQSIFNYLIDNTSPTGPFKDDILLYFADSYLKYTELDLSKTREKYGDIGRPYQQLSLHKNIDGIEVRDDVYSHADSFKGLQNFLLHKTGISLEKYTITKKKAFEELVFSTLADKGSCIISMDDYYNPMAEMVFKKQHNVHSIVLNGYIKNEDAFHVFDSNRSYPYALNKKMIIKGFFSPFMEQEILVLKRTADINLINYNESFQKYLERKPENHIIARVREVYNNIKDDENRHFCLDGFNGMASSKILPIVNMKRHVWKYALTDYPEQKEGIPETLRAIDCTWKSIILLNEVMIRKGIFTYFNKVCSHLEKVVTLENRLAEQEAAFCNNVTSMLAVCV